MSATSNTDPRRPVFASIRQDCRDKHLASADFLAEAHARAESADSDGVWIHLASRNDLLAQLSALELRRDAGESLPLFGLPFAVKDNIDVAGMPTTAACPAFSYVPQRSAFVVQRLTRAGAIVLGKTNLDQFATGLVGVRSPFGIPRNPFDPRYVPGGSSSGSAVAVATGTVAFALGTDTAGSGRVPAAFNNIVGLKPTRGLLSTAGVVPACRSLDCVSLFTYTCADAWTVFRLAQGFDPEDPYSRSADTIAPPSPLHPSFRFGVPAAADLEFFGDSAAEESFASALTTLEALGGTPVEIPFAPFLETAKLLYEGPWLAERLEAAGEILSARPDTLDPVVRTILLEARRYSALDAFSGQAHLRQLTRTARACFDDVSALVVPTAPTFYTIDQVQSDPLRLNANLGYYTNFLNLLDLCAVAVPSGFRRDGLPFGITLIGLPGSEARLLTLASRHQSATCRTLGASRSPWSGDPAQTFQDDSSDTRVAVVGAHLTGQPLNHQLVELGANLVTSARTAPHYRLYELSNTTPAKPGLVRTSEGDGCSIEVEIWRLTYAAFGAFVAKVQDPLCIGTIELETGLRVHGFLCESHALTEARDISSFGGWRNFLNFLTTVPSPSNSE